MNSLTINTSSEAKDLIYLAIYTGQLLIRNGAEIYRAEDTVVRMCESYENIYDVDAFAINTGIFLSLEFEGETITIFKNVDSTTVNLSKIDELNHFSRQFVAGYFTMAEAKEELKRINELKSYSLLTKVFFTGLCTSSFSVLFGGSYMDFFVSFLIGNILAYFQDIMGRRGVSFFLSTFLGALLVSLLAFFSKLWISEIIMDKVIIGSIMPLVPGMMVTNGIRDIISGDYLSGIIGVVKALFTAFAIALGVGVTLNLQLFIGG